MSTEEGRKNRERRRESRREELIFWAIDLGPDWAGAFSNFDKNLGWF